MYGLFQSTIAAISTPHGVGGIAVIRMSGGDASAIADRFIKPKNGRTVASMAPNTSLVADIYGDEGGLLDTAVVTLFRAPHSFTGEDTVEISCHGGILISAEVLSRCIACGASPAEAGEFSRRAFSAGKLSLSEAEAISDMIYAKSRASLRLSKRNADGALKRSSDEIYEDIKSVLSALYAGIDFPDEELSPMSKSEMRESILAIAQKLERLRASYRQGHAVVEGIKTVICGKPNTGKSTLLNLLYGSERAIVTDIAGTTRDVITEQLVCGNITLLLSDTAGIRDTGDRIELAGVRRSFEAISEAELILSVFDASSPYDGDDVRVIDAVKNRKTGCAAIAIVNKSDICSSPDISGFSDCFDRVLVLSAKNKTSFKTISDSIAELFDAEKITSENEAVITNARQYGAVCAAEESVKKSLVALDTAGEDFAGTELEAAMGELGGIDGRAVGIDIVNDIFAKFCVGK